MFLAMGFKVTPMMMFIPMPLPTRLSQLQYRNPRITISSSSSPNMVMMEASLVPKSPRWAWMASISFTSHSK